MNRTTTHTTNDDNQSFYSIFFVFETRNHGSSLLVAHAKTARLSFTTSTTPVSSAIVAIVVIVSPAASLVSRSRPRPPSSSSSVVVSPSSSVVSVSIVVIVSPPVASVPTITTTIIPSMIRISSLSSSPSATASISVHPPLLPLLAVPPKQRVRQRRVLNRSQVHKITVSSSRARVLLVLSARALPKICHRRKLALNWSSHVIPSI